MSTTPKPALPPSPARGTAWKKVIVYSIIAFWLIMCAFFVRREIIPLIYAQPLRGYAALRQYAHTSGGYRMGIYAPNGRRIGATETTYQFKGDDFEIASKAVVHFGGSGLLNLALGPAARKFELWSNVTVGPDNTLTSFRVTCDGPLLSAFAYGRVADGRLAVRLNVGDHQTLRDYPVNREDLVSCGLMAIGAQPQLRAGQVWRIRTLDPLKMLEQGTSPFSTGTATVKRKTKIILCGESYRVWEIELKSGGATARSWIDDRGDVLKEESFGIVMIREPLPHESGLRPPALTTEPAGR